MLELTRRLDAARRALATTDGSDMPDEAVERFCSLRRELAAMHPTSIEEAALMAGELRMMLEEGEAADGTDKLMARSLEVALCELAGRGSLVEIH